MANVTTYSKTGAKQEATIKLEQSIFGIEANHELVNQAYSMYLSNGRVAGATTLTRGMVAGGGKKPHPQKGTGRARAGSRTQPNWRGGGSVFGPTGNENFTKSMPIKAKRAAIRQALSLQTEAGKIAVIESFTSADGRVKPTVELLGKLKLEGKLLLVVSEKNSLVERATRNVAQLHVVSGNYLNVYTVMNADHIVFTKDSLEIVKQWLGEK